MKDKVLIISHNALSNDNNMGKSLSNLFSSYNSDRLAQLYLYPGYPDSEICNKFFRITDMDMLKSCFNKKVFGNVISNTLHKKKDKHQSKTLKNILYNIGSKKYPLSYLCRDSIWSKKRWLSNNLIKWLKSLDINIIFFASGDSCFSYDITMEISKLLDVPIVTYFCDDFYFASKFSISPFYYLYRKKYKAYIKRIITLSANLIYISPSLENAYYEEFGKQGQVIMTPSNKILQCFEAKPMSIPIIISYIGNIVMREEALIEIGNAINIINRTQKNVEFNVYTQNINYTLIRKIKRCKGINFKGSLDVDGVNVTIEKSDILVHAESFNKKLITRNKHSISTKIPESISMGKCLFAYGPKELASIKYLKENNAACVCSNKNKLIQVLSELLVDEKLRNEYAQNGLKLAMKNHQSIINSSKLKEILNQC